LSFAPELLGEKAAGRQQPQHDFLYWEHVQQVAVRRGSWKAIQPSRSGAWELYNFAGDISESTNVAGANPKIVNDLKKIASNQHSPQVIGEIYDRSLVEKDRAYFAGQKTGKAKKKQ
jgi:hypothetical protein